MNSSMSEDRRIQGLEKKLQDYQVDLQKQGKVQNGMCSMCIHTYIHTLVYLDMYIRMYTCTYRCVYSIAL